MEKLKFVAEQMAALEIPYEFGEWTSAVQYPYFVGEITEEEATTEDGAEESTFILTGFHRGKYIDLEKIKEKINMHFLPYGGYRQATEKGAIVGFYAGSFFMPTNEADLKKIQINLKIKYWKGVL